VRHLAGHGHLDLNVLHGDGTNTVAKKGGDGIGYSGHKHQKGEKILAIIDNNGFVLAPLPVAPANEADTVLLPEGLNALKRVARLADLKIGGSYLNLDGGFDSRYNRKAIFNAGLIPNIKENPRNREIPKRGRKRLFNAAIHASLPSPVRKVQHGDVCGTRMRGTQSCSFGSVREVSDASYCCPYHRSQHVELLEHAESCRTGVLAGTDAAHDACPNLRASGREGGCLRQRAVERASARHPHL
jgi:hypothetical protein